MPEWTNNTKLPMQPGHDAGKSEPEGGNVGKEENEHEGKGENQSKKEEVLIKEEATQYDTPKDFKKGHGLTSKLSTWTRKVL